jgi:Icc-related predicted phosphoesterase
MKIKLVSDLHLEFSDVNIVNDNQYDVLILGGDIMIAQDLHDHPEPANISDQAAIANSTGLGRRQVAAERFRDFLKRVSFQFPHVIYIAGNHEFYHGKYPDALDYLKQECSNFPNIYFLEMDTKEIGDVTFVGATLWTDMNRGDPVTLHAVADMMNDYRIVRNSEQGYTKLRPAHTMSRHRKTLDYIKQVVEADPTKKYVVVGHHAPSKLSTKPRYADEHIMNGAYSSDLSEFILDHPSIKLWTHGHTHHFFDYMIGSTRIVCNPRGYEGYEEDSGWNKSIVIEV